MNATRKLICAFWLLGVGLLPGSTRTAHAFPPAPHHEIYGMVRDELGRPLAGDNARIILQTESGVVIKSDINSDEGVGVNYRLFIAMDSGISPEPYKAHALQPAAPFRIKVQIGGATYLPIEMSGDLASLGSAAGRTRIDLTLGVDSDGDGLPDAWEHWLISMLKNGSTLASIDPNKDSDSDQISDYAEYLAGTYAFDPTDGFTLKVKAIDEHGPLLDLMTIRNRSYTLYSTSDFITWLPVNFHVITAAGRQEAIHTYQADVAGPLVIQPVNPQAGAHFYKARVD